VFAQLPFHERQPGPKKYGARQCLAAARSCEPQRFLRYPYRADAELAPDLENQSQQGRVYVKMLMRIDVIELEAGCAECLKLGTDLGRDLTAYPRGRERPNSVRHHRSREPATFVDQVRDFAVRQHRPAVSEHYMKPNAQCGRATVTAGMGPAGCGGIRRRRQRVAAARVSVA